jgi:hypothetical protein
MDQRLEVKVLKEKAEHLEKQCNTLLLLLHSCCYAACYHKEEDKYIAKNKAFMEALRILGHQKHIAIEVDTDDEVRSYCIGDGDDG